jgi:hypothetical protein
MDSFTYPDYNPGADVISIVRGFIRGIFIASSPGMMLDSGSPVYKLDTQPGTSQSKFKPGKGTVAAGAIAIAVPWNGPSVGIGSSIAWSSGIPVAAGAIGGLAADIQAGIEMSKAESNVKEGEMENYALALAVIRAASISISGCKAIAASVPTFPKVPENRGGHWIQGYSRAGRKK